jgi:hypothetical protein
LVLVYDWRALIYRANSTLVDAGAAQAWLKQGAEDGGAVEAVQNWLQPMSPGLTLIQPLIDDASNPANNLRDNAATHLRQEVPGIKKLLKTFATHGQPLVA